ncbi:hypothetical protein D081_1722 [Anaerovibrio sp. JC8]|uniref:hypothetical protein n=1 Tax=Anaerovibrio sp. JC8 TaxID=1240085 RepID=UPI000A0EAC84|nr:hypothetical protein [Anaerovibrio sp. JC8]ORT99572.1 hypothetical protein D081_1722 [Anaerovibrio sp. JC8]
MADSGNSLIEVLLAAAVIALAVGIAIPSLKYTDRFRLDYEAGLLAKRLQYVKEVSGEMDTFTVDGRKDCASMPGFNIKSGGQGYYYHVNSKVKESWELPRDFHITCNRAETFFYKSGEATTCTYILTLKDKSRNVVVDRVGRIRVE